LVALKCQKKKKIYLNAATAAFFGKDMVKAAFIFGS